MERKKRTTKLLGAWYSVADEKKIREYCKENRLVVSPFIRKTILDKVYEENKK